MTDDSKGAHDDLATLGAAIARMEKQLQEFKASGGDQLMVADLKRELDSLRQVQANGRVFLRAKGSDSTIIGFDLPSDRSRPAQ
jgi:hypothetical protein